MILAALKMTTQWIVITEVKYLTRKNLRKKGFILAHGLEMESIMMGKTAAKSVKGVWSNWKEELRESLEELRGRGREMWV